MRRLLQFSLTTILLVTTMVALIILAARTRRQIEESTAAIPVLQGEVEQNKRFADSQAGEYIQFLDQAAATEDPKLGMYTRAAEKYVDLQQQYSLLPDQQDFVFVVEIPTIDGDNFKRSAWRVFVPDDQRMGIRVAMTQEKKPVTESMLTDSGPFVHALADGESVLEFEWHINNWLEEANGHGKLKVDGEVVFSSRVDDKKTASQSLSLIHI